MISIIVVIVKTMFRFSIVPFKGPKKSQAPRNVSILCTGVDAAYETTFEGHGSATRHSCSTLRLHVLLTLSVSY
jgi:hypothetical protein